MARGLFGKEFSFYAVETKLFQAMSAMLTIKVEIQWLYMKWVVPEKIHTPPTDGILEILAGGGVEDSGNPGGRGG